MARIELFFPASRSLKDKRQVIQSVARTVQHKFNVAIAEVDHQDLWQRSAFGVSCIAGSVDQCRKVLQEVEKSIARTALGGGEIVDRHVEIVAMDDL